MADFASALERPTGRRNFEKGKAAFASAQCLACHKFGNEGGGVGPDLTAVASRFSRRDILESTLEPSRVVSEQFQNVTITKKDGDDVTGRVVDENAERLTLVVNPLAPESKKVIAKKRSPDRPCPALANAGRFGEHTNACGSAGSAGLPRVRRQPSPRGFQRQT